MAKKSRRSQRKGRKGSRKAHRKSTRKTQRAGSRKNTRRQRGGNYDPQRLSFLQGMEYRELHPAQFEQKGGAMLGYAPVTPGDQGLLPADLRQMARVTPIDEADAFIKNMRDPPFDTMPVKQTGGARKRKSSKKSRKASKKSRKASKKSRKGRKGSRRQHGGALLNGAPLSQPTMLLTPAQAAKAGTGDFSNPLLRD